MVWLTLRDDLSGCDASSTFRVPQDFYGDNKRLQRGRD